VSARRDGDESLLADDAVNILSSKGDRRMRNIFIATVAAAALGASVPANAADIPVKAVPVPAAVPYSWTGLYAGLNGGYSWGHWDVDSNYPIFLAGPVSASVFHTATATTTPASDNVFSLIAAPNCFGGFCTANPNVQGAFGGIQAGYNWQVSYFVVGIEGDVQGSVEKRRDSGELDFPNITTTACKPTTPCAFKFTNRWDLPWFATFRPRAGLALDRWLFYATGGLAIGEADSQFQFTQNLGLTSTTPGVCGFVTGTTPVACPSFFSMHDTAFKVGWVAGGGVEATITGSVSVKAEYLFMDFGTRTFSAANPFVAAAPAFTETVKVRDNLIRLGINVKLWAPAAPVVARY
jgi:outer membrane immunogenic protein